MAADSPTSLIALRDAREAAIDRLSKAFAHDELELDEFERRLGLAHRTDTVAELGVLTADLKGDPGAPAPVPAKALVPVAVRDRQTLIAVLGGTSRKGQWRPAQKLRLLSVLGGMELDFREAAMVPGITELRITAVLGGVHIIVPPHLAVEMDGMAIMGGFEHSERAPAQPDPERPILRIHGLAVCGGVHIETRLIGESERDAERRLSGRSARRAALPPRAQ